MSRRCSQPIQKKRPWTGPLFLFFLCLYFLITDGHFFSTDEIQIHQTTEALCMRGSLGIDPINDTSLGQGDQYYANKGLGLSIVAIPFHLVGHLAEEQFPESWSAYFAGNRLGAKASWGGKITIFAVNLTNAFVTALLCIAFFKLCLALDYSYRVSAGLAFALGIGTSFFVYAQTFFNHTLVSLCLVYSAYLLCSDGPTTRLLRVGIAGSLLGFAVITRFETVLLVPLYILYGWYRAKQKGDSQIRSTLESFAYIGVPAMVGVLVFLWVNYLKFGAIFDFGSEQFTTGFRGSLLVGLYGNLFSVGRSIFLYSPPLIAALFSWRMFFNRRKPEALFFLGIGTVYLAFYSAYVDWHGDWGWGNRFLLPVIPFMLVPLGELMRQADLAPVGKWARICLLSGIGIIGTFVQLLGTTSYVSYIYWDWNYMNLNPEQSFLFVPQLSPLAMHWKAFGDPYYLNYWLHFIYQKYGYGYVLATAALPLLGIGVSLVLLTRAMRTRAVACIEGERCGEDHEGENQPGPG